MPAKPSTTRVARAALAVASLALVAGLAEVALRLGARDPSRQPWWERIRTEQAHDTLERFPVGAMQLPLRAAPEATPKPADAYRILFLGDSFTYGLGVEAPDTFVARIGERLRAEGPRPGVARWELYNGGIPGSLTFQWRELLDRFGPGFAPDLVVAVFFLRDGVAGVATADQIDAIRDEMRALSERSWAYRNFHLYRFVRARIEQQRLSRRYLARLRQGYLGPPAARTEWLRAQTELLWMRAESRRLGARFALAIFPVLFGLDGRYPLADVCDEIERFAREEEIPVLSLLPAFRGHAGPELWISPFDQHPNERAHAIAAEALYPFVEREVRAEAPSG